MNINTKIKSISWLSSLQQDPFKIIDHGLDGVPHAFAVGAALERGHHHAETLLVYL